MELCGDEDMAALVRQMQASDTEDLAAVDAALKRFPQDPRLHFMRGSILAGRKEPREAHAALARAVELAPDFAIARYQLGLTHLARDEVEPALARMREGIALNREKDPLNGDIRLLMAECERARKAGGGPTEGDEGEGSDLPATSLLLGQFPGGPTRH